MIVGAVAILVAVVFGVRALSAPVERAGEPTIAVPSPSGTRFTSPSASPSATTTTSPTSTSTSAKPSSTATSTVKASGDFDWSSATMAASGSTGTLYRFAVAVESSAKLKPNGVAMIVAGVLNDPRSWTGDGKARFALVGQDQAQVKVYLASTKTATTLCGSDAESAYSCVKGDTVVINAAQWKAAAQSYSGDLADYRAFLTNHAFGHLIGKNHATCPGKGKKAPVMLQQAAGLNKCVANPWP